MNKFFIIFGIILLSFSFITCDNGNGSNGDNDTEHEHGDICYEHNMVYGIPVTGSPTGTQLNAVKAGFDYFKSYAPAKDWTWITKNVKEITLTAGPSASVSAGGIASIGSSASEGTIAAALEDFVWYYMVFLQINDGIRLAGNF